MPAQTPATLGLAMASDVTTNTTDIATNTTDIATNTTGLTTVNTRIDNLDLEDLNNVSGTPTNGQYLSYNGTNWTPTTAPGGGSNTVTVSDSGRTINIGSDATQIPVITSGSLSSNTSNTSY